MTDEEKHMMVLQEVAQNDCVEDQEYGSNCWYCTEDLRKRHAPNCAWLLARELLGLPVIEIVGYGY